MAKKTTKTSKWCSYNAHHDRKASVAAFITRTTDARRWASVDHLFAAGRTMLEGECSDCGETLGLAVDVDALAGMAEKR